MAPTLPPPSITVTLRVVGIQYQEDVVITVANPTIKDLMEAARGGDRNFEYTTALDDTLRSASARLLTETKSISSGEVYPPGLYSLSDGILGENSITTWQWYVINKTGQQTNQPDGKTEAFSLPKADKLPAPQYRFLQNGDEVIWRLVVVAVKAKIKEGQTSFRSKVERLPNSGPDAGNEPVNKG